MGAGKCWHPCGALVIYKIKSRTSAVSSTNFSGKYSFLQAALSVRAIYYVGELFLNGRGHYILLKIYIHKILLWCQVFGLELFVSAEVCDSRNWNSRSNIASFERRVRGAAPTPLALPCPFRSAHRRERGRMPSETSKKLQKYRMSRRNSEFFC